MGFDIAAAFGVGLAIGASVVAAALRARLRSTRDAMNAIAKDVEASQDAQWRAAEREQRALRDGEAALAEAEARAEAGARAKSKFLATVTHEMRTPLSGVIGTTDLLLDTALAPDQRTYARAVKQSAEALLSLVDEILDMSRIEAGGLTLQDAPFSVAELVEGVAELLAPRAHAKGLELAVGIGRGTPAEAVGDVARVRQILLNLAGNAIKFTAKGGVGLRVDADADGLSFTVSDTGPGFDPMEAERLFQEFEQNAADPAAGGVGLGLAISRRLAQAMGGSLTADASPGQGATFTFRLAVRAGAPAAVEDDGTALSGRRVLVVTAAPFGGPWLVRRLGEWGADAEQVGPDADVAAAARGFDTVLVDRAATPAGGSVAALGARNAGADKVLLLLSPAERRDLPTLAEHGFDGYLVKPIRVASLLSRLQDPQPGAAVRTTERRTTTEFPTAGGLRVLLAEDDPVSALIALAHLGRLGCSAAHVGDGLSACAAFEAEPFDVVLLDLRMPQLDGCAVAAHIREIEASEGRPRAAVIAVTANALADEGDRALASGMDAVLSKPLDHERLTALLETLMPADIKVA